MNEKYIIIPVELVCDNNISSSTKILYGVIKSLSYKEGFCFASNSYLASIVNLDNRTITRHVSILLKNGYIKIMYNNENIRKIYPLK